MNIHELTPHGKVKKENSLNNNNKKIFLNKDEVDQLKQFIKIYTNEQQYLKFLEEELQLILQRISQQKKKSDDTKNEYKKLVTELSDKYEMKGKWAFDVNTLEIREVSDG